MPAPDARPEDILRQAADAESQAQASVQLPPELDLLAEVLKAVPNLLPVAPAGATITSTTDAPPPLRFCSIKGCKTVLAPNSYFKMCEPCRDRYRNYGTAKRQKWRKEKEAVVAEVQKLCEVEDARRAEEGLPVSALLACVMKLYI